MNQLLSRKPVFAALKEGSSRLLLNAFIRQASDGRLVLRVEELPDVAAVAGSVDGIEEVVRTAAAEHTGRNRDEFDVQVHY